MTAIEPPSGVAAESGDRELVAAYLRGRGEGAFRALYRRHTPRIYQLALRILSSPRGGTSGTGRRRDAEEAVQETWIRAAERLDRFAWRSSLATWLAGIAINVCRDRLRHGRARLQPVAVDDLEAIDRARPESGDDRRLDLERAISSLPRRYRQVLVLHDVEGYTHREIGHFLDIETGTSKSQLFHARKAMRRHLGGGRRTQRKEIT